ncbi:MAG: SRPBCC domain-containing protein [Candidatus Sulfotelmatobacter sp.]
MAPSFQSWNLKEMGRLVFKAWTDTKHMAQWWGPNGFTNPVCELDVRASGNPCRRASAGLSICSTNT